jgi:AcrR family transcriptional regulator
MRKPPSHLAQKLAASADGFAATFDDLRMDDIAEISGIPRATLYYYFAGKDDILAFLLQSQLEALKTKLATASTGGGSLKARLTELVRLQLAEIAASPAAAQLLLSNLGRLGKLPDLAASVQDVFLAPIDHLLGQAGSAGEITSSAIFGAVTVVGLRAIVLDGWLDADRLAAQLVDLFWTGLAAPAPPVATVPTKKSKERSRRTAG